MTSYTTYIPTVLPGDPSIFPSSSLLTVHAVIPVIPLYNIELIRVHTSPHHTCDSTFRLYCRLLSFMSFFCSPTDYLLCCRPVVLHILLYVFLLSLYRSSCLTLKSCPSCRPTCCPTCRSSNGPTCCPTCRRSGRP
jgi:hypothetical protein